MKGLVQGSSATSADSRPAVREQDGIGAQGASGACAQPGAWVSDRPHATPSIVAISRARVAPAIKCLTGGQPLPADLRGAIVALGNFDGFHLGHQAVASQALKMARARGVAAVIGTFDPHPAAFFKRSASPFRLTSLETRQRLIAEAGLDGMLVFEFDQTLACVTPEDFVRTWLDGFGGVVTGENFRFGRGGQGDVAALAALGASNGMECRAIRAVESGDDLISSTRIRRALADGDCAEAARLLSRPYAIETILRRGSRQDLGSVPFYASVALNDFLRPRSGVYAVRARISDGRNLEGTAYVSSGRHNAADGALELFLGGLRERDFGMRVEVELLAHLHDADRDYTTEALRQQIARDDREARRILSSLAA